MTEIAKYLLPSERHALEVRHHWAALSGYAATAAAFWAGGLIALYLFLDVALLRSMSVFFLLFTVGWFLWMVGEWYVERFVVTDRRVLLLTGILTKRVAVMPLAKVTDLTYERSVLGRLLGYGVFNIESAGQQQALSRIDFIPHPDQLYQEVSGLLFGSQGGEDDGTGSAPPPGPHRRPGGPRPHAGPGPHGPLRPDLPRDPRGPDGPRARLWAPTGQGGAGAPVAEQGSGHPEDPQPWDSQPWDSQPWGPPPPPDHRAAAPTAPLPTIR